MARTSIDTLAEALHAPLSILSPRVLKVARRAFNTLETLGRLIVWGLYFLPSKMIHKHIHMAAVVRMQLIDMGVVQSFYPWAN